MKLHTYIVTGMLGVLFVAGTTLPVLTVHATEISEDDSMQSMNAEQLQEIIKNLQKEIAALEKKSGKKSVKEKTKKEVEEKLEKPVEIMKEMFENKLAFLADLKEGMSGEEVVRLQKILASDPAIYPEGLATGYFGPLTAKALARLQAKHALKAEGMLTTETREFINSLLATEKVTEVSPELLRVWEVKKQIKMLTDSIELLNHKK